MRQRVTFLHKPEDGIDPAILKVTDNSLTGPKSTVAREDRVTLALDELPDELRQVLQSCHELHIRWVSPYSYDSVSPLYSRLSPGFHLFYTPQADSRVKGQVPFSQQVDFEPGLIKAQKSFTSLPTERFFHSTAYQYYQLLENLSPFIKYAHEELCPAPSSSPSEGGLCASRFDHLSTASSLDISYDTISHALKVTATWGLQEQPLAITAPDSGNHRVEVGILATDSPHGLEPHELGLSGSLTVLGQDKKPSPTIFKFPARHRHVEGASFSTEFLEPTGLHPALQIRLNGEATRPPNADIDDGSHCSLHAYLTLPRAVFADKYQLSDPLFLESKNLTALRYITQPVDLEAPDYAMKPWGSSALLELSPPSPPSSASSSKSSSSSSSSFWTAEVPLHLRYLSPALGGYRTAEAPYPAVFWACTTEEGTKFPSSPFERVNLGYDGLFGPRTVFWHVDPAPQAAGGRLINGARVPVLDLAKSDWVSAGTAAVVLLGFGWIVWKLIVVYLKTGYGPDKQMKGLEEKKDQ